MFTISAFVGVQQAAARPSRADLEAARARLNALNQQMDSLVEQYDQAQIALNEAQARLADAKTRAQQANAEATAAQKELSTRAALAYQGVGSELDVLLGSSSVSELSDRLEFLDQIAGSDADAVTNATVAGQKAHWASLDLARAVQARVDIVHSLAQKKAEIDGAVSEQHSLIAHIEDVLSRPVYVPQDAAVAPPVVRSIAPTPTVSGSVQAVLDAAYSVIGVPYVYAGSSPEGGFDCSGFTMWAWSHAGVSLPHSSAMQYDVLPHVDRSQLQPGDLVFFYSPIHHVGLYVGDGMMIHAPHTGAYVEKVPVYDTEYVGAARPG